MKKRVSYEVNYWNRKSISILTGGLLCLCWQLAAEGIMLTNCPSVRPYVMKFVSTISYEPLMGISLRLRLRFTVADKDEVITSKVKVIPTFSCGVSGRRLSRVTLETLF